MQLILENYCSSGSGVASSKFFGAKKIGGAKMFDIRRITLFCLRDPLSKHKIYIC